MSHAFIALGKAGDILSVAPILQHAYRESGKKQHLLVSKEYLPIAERLTGVIPVVFDGSFFDLQGAIKFAKQHYRKVTPLQVFDKTTHFQKTTPSFQLDQWARGGAVRNFCDEDWKLEIPRKVKWPYFEKPTVLYADLSQSSPFKYKEDLAKLIKRTLPDHKMIRLSEMKLDNFCDFLPLYDAADLIVTVETAHLHLTRATKTPVIAMIQDKPERWHGSAWHPRFKIHCRYSDFPSRKEEVSRAMLDAVSGKPALSRDSIKTFWKHGYNPSTIEFDDKILMTYRWHNHNDWRTTLSLDVDGKDFDIIFPENTAGYSIEDGRLFTLRGNLMLSYVVARVEHGLQNCVVQYGELANNGKDWFLKDPKQPDYGHNGWSGMEKNWLPFDHAGKLHFIYQSSPEQIVLEVEGDKVIKVYKSKGAEWPYGDIRGGCMVQHGDKLLRFFHSHTTEGPRESWIYRCGASFMNPMPPFQTLQVSSHPIIAGDERWTPCRHWKQNVVWPGGVVERVATSGPRWQLACGANDCESVNFNIHFKDLNLA